MVYTNTIRLGLAVVSERTVKSLTIISVHEQLVLVVSVIVKYILRVRTVSEIDCNNFQAWEVLLNTFFYCVTTRGILTCLVDALF